MAKFYRIQIETIYLTSDGLAGGTKCRSLVSGVDQLSLDFIRTVEPSRDGTPVVQTFAYTKGKPIEIQIETLPKAVGEDLIELFNDLMQNATTLTVIGSEAETPSFNVECEFLSFNFRETNSAGWRGAIIKLITT